MGGLNASVILPQADMRAAARIAARSAIGYASQKCTATSRMVVVGDRTDFDEAPVAELAGLQLGDPADGAVEIGPVISSTARAAVLDAAARAAHGGGAAGLFRRRRVPRWHPAGPQRSHVPSLGTIGSEPGSAKGQDEFKDSGRGPVRPAERQSMPAPRRFSQVVSCLAQQAHRLCQHGPGAACARGRSDVGA